MLNDKLLIWKFNRGKTDVLHRIYDKYKNDMTTLAAALLNDRSCAEDVVHDVFVTFIKSCGSLKLTENLKGYLTTCVANNARNKNKAGQRCQNSPIEQDEPIASDSYRPDSPVVLDEQSQRLTQALCQLSYEQREVVLLHLYSGLKFKAIADLQGKSINTIQGRYRYGLNKLRSILDGEAKK